MGTLFRIVLYAHDADAARAAATEAFARVAELDAALSDYDAASELSRLARRSDEEAPTAEVPLSRDLGTILACSLAWAERTGGAFDPTVGPLVRLWRRAVRQGKLPAEEDLYRAAESVGFGLLALTPDARTARLLARDMRLDLGGIAKGFAVDEAFELLARRGLERVLVDGGGDLRVGRAPPGRAGWLVGLAGFEGTVERQWLVLEHASVATSGDLERFLEIDGVRHSHLIDPRSGRAVTRRALVTVLGERCTDVDALASAVSVLGVDGLSALGWKPDGYELRVLSLDSAPGAEATLWLTEGLRDALSSEEPETPSDPGP